MRGVQWTLSTVSMSSLVSNNAATVMSFDNFQISNWYAMQRDL